MSGFTLTSLRSAIKSKLHIDSPYVDAAISEAMRFYRAEPMDFNMGEHKFTTVADTFTYSLPDDFISIRGQVFATPSGSEETVNRYRLQPRTADEIETIRFGLTDYDSPISSSTPKMWAMDHGGKLIIVAPVSSSGGDIVYFKYTKDLETPDYTSSTTSASAPSLGNTTTLVNSAGITIASTFKNAWLENAFDLILNRSMFYLLVDYHGSAENFQKADVFRLRAEDELKRLKGETASSQAPIRLRRYW